MKSDDIMPIFFSTMMWFLAFFFSYSILSISQRSGFSSYLNDCIHQQYQKEKDSGYTIEVKEVDVDASYEKEHNAWPWDRDYAKMVVYKK